MNKGGPFVQIPRAVTNDSRLSLKAFGLLVFIADKPTDWVFSAKRISSMRPDGEKSVISAIKELETLGYLNRVKQPNGNMTYQLDLLPEKGNRVPNAEKGQQGVESQLPEKANSQKGKQTKSASISKTQSDSKTQASRKTQSPQAPQGDDVGLLLSVEDESPSLQEIVRIIRPACGANRPAKEQNAFNAIKPKPTFQEIELLRKFYALNKSERCDSTWSRKQQPLTLLRDYRNQIELAKQHFEADAQPASTTTTKPDWLIEKELKARLSEIAQIKNDTNWSLAPHAYRYEDDPIRIEARKKWSAWRNGIIAEEKQLRTEMRRLQGDAA